MQGGGARVSGSASFIDCNFYDNEANQARARILNLLLPSSSAPLNSDTLRCLTRRATLVLAFEPSGSFFQRPAGTLRDLLHTFAYRAVGSASTDLPTSRDAICIKIRHHTYALAF